MVRTKKEIDVLSQYRVFLIVGGVEAIEILIQIILMSIGMNQHNAIYGVAAVGAITALASGFVTAEQLEWKAHSPTGSPRISLASSVMTWFGFGTFLSVNLFSPLPGLVQQGGYIEILLQAVFVMCAVVLASRALNAEVIYVARKAPPSILYLPFFTIGIALPTGWSFLPTWLALVLLIVQVIFVLMLTIIPWNSIERRKAA